MKIIKYSDLYENLEDENSINFQNIIQDLKNELDSIDDHSLWEIGYRIGRVIGNHINNESNIINGFEKSDFISGVDAGTTEVGL